jgi:methionine salvage enolase-phosphatase E1
MDTLGLEPFLYNSGYVRVQKLHFQTEDILSATPVAKGKAV